jgi:uncharacterized protein
LETPQTSPAVPGPVTQAERIASIDVLRGFAVLGILIMNIQAFSMIGSAYMNPTSFGDLSGANFWVWFLSHVLVDEKFMAIFSMLFGAGIYLMTSRREAAGQRAALLHYRRVGVLLIIGLLHAYLLWYGDILYHYAVCGLLLYLFRRWRPVPLIIAGTLTIAVGSALMLFFHWSMQFWSPEQVQDLRGSWAPLADLVAKEIEGCLGGWLGQIAHRAPTAFFFQTFLMLVSFLWRAGGLMLVGMGLFKLEVFSAKRSSVTYLLMIAASLLLGIPIILYGVRYNFALAWDLRSCFFLGGQFNYWGSLLVSFGWIGLVMLVCKHGVARAVTRPLAAVGQMALTNYLLQTFICTTIFYGHGLGMFGKVERIGQIGIVLAIWVVLLVISRLWLRRFRFGPFEWLWRSLTYMKAQPLRRA